ncbi:MAG: glycosyltransferase family 4 protein [Streptosporangiaceae bacterium]
MTRLDGLDVAVVNWRDPWHPQAGGAERYAWEMALGLVARGAKVRYVTARAPGQPRTDRRDGIPVIRLGGRFTVYPLVLGYLLLHRRSIDAVLDCQNGIPFFTPWVVRRRARVVLVMHHVHTTQFGVHFPPWMARAGRFLEGPVARRAYARHPCAAVSPSTVAAMRDRLRWPGSISIVHNGVTQSPSAPADQPADRASLSWVGRLVAHKRVELLIPLARRMPAVTIDVIGHGPAAAALDDAPANIEVHGYLSEDEKHALVARSVLHLNTSQGEGWGLCVIEAAASGVPTVAFDVEGLRDSIRDGETGWLVRDGESLADVTERALKELADPARRDQIAAACRAWAAGFTWDSSADQMAKLLVR